MEDNLKLLKVEYLCNQLWLMSSKGEIRGKLRGNLECGSAQPSLLYGFEYDKTQVNLILAWLFWRCPAKTLAHYTHNHTHTNKQHDWHKGTHKSKHTNTETQLRKHKPTIIQLHEHTNLNHTKLQRKQILQKQTDKQTKTL